MAKDSFFILLRYLLDFVCKDTVFLRQLRQLYALNITNTIVVRKRFRTFAGQKTSIDYNRHEKTLIVCPFSRDTTHDSQLLWV